MWIDTLSQSVWIAQSLAAVFKLEKVTEIEKADTVQNSLYYKYITIFNCSNSLFNYQLPFLNYSNKVELPVGITTATHEPIE